MKKKNIFSTIITLTIISAFCGCFASEYTKFSSKFIRNFRDCDSYTETVNSQFEGRNFTTTRQIIGWNKGFCRYKETIVSPTDSYSLSCSFSSVQVEDLYNAMRKDKNKVQTYNLETFAEQKDKNGNIKIVSAGFQEIRGNLAYITWAKYQNNPYFCSPTRLK